MSETSFCARSSRDGGEELAGTAAAETRAWILVELASSWAPKPLDSDGIGPQLRAAIEGWIATIPHARLQLIRRHRGHSHSLASPQPSGGQTLLLASSSPSDPWLARLDVADQDALIELDVPALFEQRGGPDARRLDRVHLVCTHGRRDRCCAKWGAALYQAAVAIDPERVWQTTHLGGHRFAATAVSLPAGICYGRMRAEDAGAWLGAEARGQCFDLSKVRGRTAHPLPAQAAEVFLRKDLGELSHGAVTLAEILDRGEAGWSVTFHTGQGDRAVEVERVTTAAMGFGSCTDEAPRPIVNFRRRA